MPAKASPTHRKRPDATLKAAKVKAEADAQTAFWDRLERMGGKVLDALTAPGVIPAIAGGVLGGVAMYPQTIDFVMDLDDVEIYGTGTPPAQKDACERAAKARYDVNTARINAEYQACFDACSGPPDRRQYCQEGCEKERLRKQRAEDARYFRDLDACGQFTVNGERHRFHFTAFLTAYFHTLIPSVGIDVPAINLPIFGQVSPAVKWNLRDAFKFQLEKVITVDIAAVDGVVSADAVAAARKKAEATLTATLKRDFLVMGVALGASGGLVASFLSGTGEVLKGIGEIVPG